MRNFSDDSIFNDLDISCLIIDRNDTKFKVQSIYSGYRKDTIKLINFHKTSLSYKYYHNRWWLEKFHSD